KLTNLLIIGGGIFLAFIEAAEIADQLLKNAKLVALGWGFSFNKINWLPVFQGFLLHLCHFAFGVKFDGDDILGVDIGVQHADFLAFLAGIVPTFHLKLAAK